jgi:murein DD-endopeptidase MepM/ murein hydrolase activator NlpD
VVAIPLGSAPGSHVLTFEAAAGERRQLTIEVAAHDYGEQRLTLPKKMVTPMRPETLAKIKRDRELLHRVYASSGNHLLFQGEITPPLHSRLTSTFGRRRLLNGKPKAPHGGIDYKAPVGVPVPAAGDGRVVLAENLYYSGNLVIIDHGLDIFTLYMHLSRIDCHPGEEVHRGQIIGKSGRSGRVTGPHLHWGVKIAGVFVDPLEFARLSRLLAESPWEPEPGQGD